MKWGRLLEISIVLFGVIIVGVTIYTAAKG